MKHILLLILLSISALNAKAQTIDEVKNSRDYYWGEGVGKTASLADKSALDMLMSAISVNVESKFSSQAEQTTQGNKTEYSEYVHSIVETHSSATLRNTEILSWGEEPEVHVFRFVLRSDVNKIFAERERKVRDFVAEALKAESKGQVADALRYWYWALLLLQSLPDAGNIVSDVTAGGQTLSVFIPRKINEVFAQLRFRIAGNQPDGDLTRYYVDVIYNDRPAANCDYSFFDGRNWSLTVAAKDGHGMVETVGAQPEQLRVKIEYAFENEWKTDKEVENVLQKVEPVIFKNSYIDVHINPLLVAESNKKQEAKSEKNGKIADDDTQAKLYKPVEEQTVVGKSTVQNLLSRVETAVRNKNYDAARDCFTEEGYDIFVRLVKFGRCVPASKQKTEWELFDFEDGIMARALSLSFSFKGNRRVFVEDVVFNIDTVEQKIRSIAFGLNKAVYDEIMHNEYWDGYSRLAIVNFLENYKTAYALKRLDYIESIFSEDALIIVGKVVHKTDDRRLFQTPNIRLTQYTKAEYVRHLGGVFRSNEYVNLRFTDVNVKKAGKGGEIYGIQVSQDYFSTNYGDKGYLFLLADLNDTARPIIHVRTWQPEKDPDFGIYDLVHF